MTSPVSALDRLATPVGVVDLERARRNARRVAAYCREHGLGWRPHVKTHKSLRLARMELEAGATGLTVATPREAEVMAEVCRDLLLAYPPVGPHVLDRILSLPEEVRLRVALDDRAVLTELAGAAGERGREVGVLVEIDVGARRVGVATPAEVVALAGQAAASPGVRFDGVAFYPGHIRVPPERQGPLLEEVATLLGEVVGALAAEGLAPDIVSGGSTPTLFSSHQIPHLTEIRPGTFLLNDRDALALGVAGEAELAYSVLATVVSTAVPGRAVVDAGTKALGKEARGGGSDFGILLDHTEVPIVSLSEEHGVLDVSETEWRPRVGERVRVLPNHVCVSVNLQDRIAVVTEDGIHEWALEGRGREPWS